MKKQTVHSTLASLGLLAALLAIFAWYYHIYVNWQPQIYPLTVIAVILGMAGLSLFVLWRRGEKKKALIWKSLSCVAAFAVALFGPSTLINNVLRLGARRAALAAMFTVAIQIFVLYLLLLKSRKIRRIASLCFSIVWLIGFTLMIGAPLYMENHYRAAIPVLPEGQFATMPKLGAVDFTVPDDGNIEQVCDLIREARANGEDKHFTVLIEDGEYSITQLAFDERDHDTTYRSRDGNVILNGSIALDPKDFIAWEKNANVKVIDLTKLGLAPGDWGEMYPHGAHTMAARYDNGVGPLPCELYCNGRRMTIARYPNGDAWLKTGSVLDGGDRSDERNPRGGTFELDSETAKRAASWANARDIWVFGFFKYDWAETTTHVQAIDSEARTLTTEHGSNYGFDRDKPYFFYNILEELDEPGEWYLDRDAGLLYLWPLEENFADARIELTLNTKHLIVGDNLKNLSFIGLTLQGTRGDAMVLRGEGLTVSHCVVQNIAGSAITIDGYNNTIANNTVRHVGSKGVSISGGDYVTLTPGNNRAVNNLVHDWAEVILTYQGGVNVYGVGNTLAHNEIHSAPHTAIFFGGNNNVIEYNLIYNVCMETDDAGAMYGGRSLWNTQGTAIRNNVINNLGGKGRSPNGIYLDDGLSGVTVERYLLVNVPGASLALGGGRDLEVHGNMVVNGAMGYDDRSREGAIDPGSMWADQYGPDGHMWPSLEASPWQTDIWKAAYPKLAVLSTDFADIEEARFAANPAGSSVTGNVFIGPDSSRFAESVRRFGEIGPNAQYNMLAGRKYWTLPGYENIPLELVGRVGR